jgi:hypothetical protein
MRIAFLLTHHLERPSGLGLYWPLAKEIAHLYKPQPINALAARLASRVRPPCYDCDDCEGQISLMEALSRRQRELPE